MQPVMAQMSATERLRATQGGVRFGTLFFLRIYGRKIPIDDVPVSVNRPKI
jgi:hypothetical protein